MILHLHTDSRFTEYVVDLFYSEEHLHLVGKRFPGQKIQNNSSKGAVKDYVFGWSNASRLIHETNPLLVVVHFLDHRWHELISKLPEKVQVIWIFWGGDGYSLPEMKADLYGPETERYLEQIPGESKLEKMKAELGVTSIIKFSFLTSIAFEALRKIRWPISTFDAKISLFKRMDYCGTFLKEDYQLLKERYAFKMKWIDARFISLEQLIGSLETEKLSGTNILLGNSCTLENNHLDAFNSIRSLNLEDDQEVICPLSYGKNLGSYQKEVIDSGSQTFGSSFHPLIKLLSLEDYTKLLRSCSFAIMYHHRQQAFNNILALVYLGVKVYLKPQNTIYAYLKRVGCEVFSTKELVGKSKLIPLNEAQIANNRKKLKEEFSQVRIAQSAQGLIQLAKEKVS